jgi:hypothetical protein
VMLMVINRLTEFSQQQKKYKTYPTTLEVVGRVTREASLCVRIHHFIDSGWHLIAGHPLLRSIRQGMGGSMAVSRSTEIYRRAVELSQATFVDEGGRSNTEAHGLSDCTLISQSSS